MLSLQLGRHMCGVCCAAAFVYSSLLGVVELRIIGGGGYGMPILICWALDLK
jgi:hypothetical protein